MNIALPKDEMVEILEDATIVVRDRIIEHGRWTVTHELIFKRDGKLWRATYRVGATEGQDEQPWEYDDVITCVEVIEVPAVDYKPVEA